MKIKAIITSIITLYIISVSAQYPRAVLSAVQKAKTNQQELLKALDFFYKEGDSLKIKSIDFLVANMPIHNSSNYYWADSLGHKIAYDEVNYATFNDAVSAFEQLKTQHPKLHPVPYTYRDIDSIKASFLIENVTFAVDKYRERKININTTTEEEFLEYVLPYRVSVEPLRAWRKTYMEKFDNSFDNKETLDKQLLQLKEIINARFKNLWGIEVRAEPLPRLDPLQILLRGKGYCEDMADMATFIARSKGIPATVDNIPVWATTSGNHFLNFLKLDTANPHFDAAQETLGREPSKVLRTTYSPQPDAVATWLDTAYIPKGFLRIKNYKDVTSEHWRTDSITPGLFSTPGKNFKVAYLSVFSSAQWQPIWYGIKKGNKATFKNMSKGVVYLPMFYENNSVTAAGWPYLLSYDKKVSLKPDTVNTQTITLLQQEKYLKYRPNKKYRLYFWNNQWQMVGDKTAPEGCTELVFAKVPKNALFIMIPEYSQGRERPFTINDKGERLWW